MYLSPAYTITAAAAVSAAFSFLPYPWAHQAAGAIQAGLMAWAGYHAYDQVRETLADRKRARVSQAHSDLKASSDD